MVWLGALIIGAGVAWSWLVGHWSGRVLAFLMFAATFGPIGFIALGGDPRGADPHGLLGALWGVGAAWCAASLPIWIKRAMRATASPESSAALASS